MSRHLVNNFCTYWAESVSTAKYMITNMVSLKLQKFYDNKKAKYMINNMVSLKLQKFNYNKN